MTSTGGGRAASPRPRPPPIPRPRRPRPRCRRARASGSRRRPPPRRDGTRVFAVTVLGGTRVGLRPRHRASHRATAPAPTVWTLDQSAAALAQRRRRDRRPRRRGALLGVRRPRRSPVKNAAGTTVKSLSITGGHRALRLGPAHERRHAGRRTGPTRGRSAPATPGATPPPPAPGTFTVDGTAPVSRAVAASTAGTGGWLVSPVPGHADRHGRRSPASARSAGASTVAPPPPTRHRSRIATNGQADVEYRATDRAGNREAWHSAHAQDRHRPTGDHHPAHRQGRRRAGHLARTGHRRPRRSRTPRRASRRRRSASTARRRPRSAQPGRREWRRPPHRDGHRHGRGRQHGLGDVDVRHRHHGARGGAAGRRRRHAPTVTPNGDGSSETVTIPFSVSEPRPSPPSSPTPTRRSSARSPASVLAATGRLTWDGRTAAGRPVPDGRYTVTLDAGRSGGQHRRARSRRRSTSTRRSRRSPGRRRCSSRRTATRLAPKSTATFRLLAPATVTVRVVDASGAVVRTGPDRHGAPGRAGRLGVERQADDGHLRPPRHLPDRGAATNGTQSAAQTAVVPPRRSGRDLGDHRGPRARPSRSPPSPRRGCPPTPRVVVRQPGLAAWTVTMTKVDVHDVDGDVRPRRAAVAGDAVADRQGDGRAGGTNASRPAAAPVARSAGAAPDRTRPNDAPAPAGGCAGCP